MKCLQFIITFCLLLFCGAPPQCQGIQKKYVYQDSAILYPEADQLQASESGEESETGLTRSFFTDTSLVNNRLVLSADSIKALQNARPFAYAKSLDSLLKTYRDGQQESDERGTSFLDLFFAARGTKIFFWTAAVFFIVFIVYKLFFAQGFFQRQSTATKVTVLNEAVNDEKGAADYNRLVGQAVSNKNYRLAVRYLYLQTLQKLASAGAIDFAADKTNAAYLRELSGKGYKNQFAVLTRHYEFIWYGELAIDEAVYQHIESRFKQFDNSFKQD